MWGALLSVYGQLLIDDGVTLRRTVVLGDLGLVAGALIAHQVPMSRGRTLIIDLGGVLGSLAGGLFTLSTSSDQTAGGVLFTTTAAGLAAVGAALGLGAAAYFTRDWNDHDDDGPGLTTMVTPVRGGGLLSAHLAW